MREKIGGKMQQTDRIKYQQWLLLLKINQFGDLGNGHRIQNNKKYTSYKINTLSKKYSLQN